MGGWIKSNEDDKKVENYSTKIIFLDIDGVLCTHRACVPKNDEGIFTYLDPVGIDMLNDICDKTGAKIVVSSSWRKLTKNMDMVLASAGLKQKHLYFSIHDNNNHGFYTPHVSVKGNDRGYEIEDWLEHHSNITDYIILDDNTDFLDHQKPFLVQTDCYDGIGYRDYKKVLQLFGYGNGPPIELWNQVESENSVKKE